MLKKIVLFLILAAFVFSGLTGLNSVEAATLDFSFYGQLEDFFTAPLEKNEIAFVSLPFSGVLIRILDVTILIDPANLLSDDDLVSLKAAGLDLLLYTHGHGDHLHLPTAQKIYEDSQPRMAADPDIVGRIKRVIPTEKLIAAEPGESYDLGNIHLDAVEGKHIGSITLFKVTVGNISLFHGGDSAAVPLENYRSDIAFLPTGSPSPTASPDDAFKMAQDLKPQVVVVMHGSDEQNAEFKTKMNQSYPEIEVIIPELEKTVKVSLKK